MNSKLVLRVFTVLLVLLGIGLRLWVLNSPIGLADSDESVVGLMARDFLQGEWASYFWGQAYGGSFEAMVAALLFAVFGVSATVLKFSTILLSAASALVLWRIAQRVFSSDVSAFAAALFWSTPMGLVWLSTKERGFYGSGMLFGLLTIWCVLRFLEKPQLKTAFFGGVSVGLALWSTPQAMYFVIPAGLVLLVRAPRSLLRAWPALPGLALGYLPGLLYNFRNGWLSVDTPEGASRGNSYFDRLGLFATEGFGGLLGARVPYSREWLPGLGPIAVAVGLAAVVWGFWRWRQSEGVAKRTWEVFLLFATLFPFIFAISPYSWYLDEPRYVSFLWPTLVLFLVGFMGKWRVLGSILFGAMSIWTMVFMVSWSHTSLSHDFRTLSVAPIREYLRQHQVTHAYGDYWIAYRVTLDSDGKKIIEPGWQHRNPELTSRVEASTEPTIYFAFDDSSGAAFGERALVANEPFVVTDLGHYLAFHFERDLPAHEVFRLANP